jgi:hypothetical protein
MSYIIRNAQPFTSVKLTEVGREKIAKGELNFSSWSIGDSEINYNREGFVQDDVLTGSTTILRPKDKQPDLKYFISKNNNTNKNPFVDGDISCVKLRVNNEAEQRGPFTGSLSSGWETLTETSEEMSGYTRSSGTISSSAISGGNTLEITGNNAEVGDILLLKIGYSDFTNETPQPHLFYKIQVTGSTITVDRELPTLSSGNTSYIIYKGGDIYNNEPDSIGYWDTGTLSFDSSCDITVNDVPLWNMNIPFSENVLGITGTTQFEKLENFGSYNYIGQVKNYLYNSEALDVKSSAIIHYSNKTISNLYGEYLFIDNDTKNVKIHLPNIMYHRRNFNGVSGTGDKMGMTFIASGPSINSGANGLTYVELIEDPSLVEGTPKVVGRVYTQLKIIVVTDPEVNAAMSYKSNRNWTLPKLNLTLTNPSGGVGTGVLPAGQTMYVTYRIDNESGSGLRPTLPAQNYSRITNNNNSSFDIQFNMEDVGLLPYMRDDDSTVGFYGDTFKVLYQVTNGSRPVTDAWQEVDFSSSVDENSDGFVDVDVLERQNPLALTPSFQLTQSNTSSSTTYSIIDKLNMVPSTSPETLQFGDERFFYGNVEAFIGATIFKTIFKISINASDFNRTSNATRSNDLATNPPNIMVSEVGVYDSNGDLVIIGKLSKPAELSSGKTVILELSIDF